MTISPLLSVYITMDEYIPNSPVKLLELELGLSAGRWEVERKAYTSLVFYADAAIRFNSIYVDTKTDGRLVRRWKGTEKVPWATQELLAKLCITMPDMY
ncbi:hypothetical protein Y1Q_0019619 [Alligator mississippiensis]|uniref:Uncharacterized protein n=1 Tax=Alligator mississippiensis TaxID=8496 RepID=A0A151PEG5_ALLMI|nr:hypothetical protein Y1Q_0019619 [Alligator mississippiensis]